MKQPCRPFPDCRPVPPPPPLHPDGCGCPACRQRCGYDRCPSPSCADQPRFLLPRVIASGRVWHRCASFSLQPEGLPDCLQPPLMLVGVCAGCQPPAWELTPGEHPSTACIRLLLPLSCQIRDCSGRTHCATAWIETEASIRLGIPFCECWRMNVMVLPCIRMVCPPQTSQCGCFDVQLEISADIYLTRWETCAAGRKPDC